MPTERLPALGHDGNAYVVVRKTPGFPAISRRDSQYDMARYQLGTGEELAPTGEPQTCRTADGKIVLTLIVNRASTHIIKFTERVGPVFST